MSKAPIVVSVVNGAQARFWNRLEKGGGVYIRIDRRGGAPLLLTMAMAHQVVDIYNQESGYHAPDCPPSKNQGGAQR